MRRIIAAFALACMIFAGGTGMAMADEACDPTLSATGCMDNVTCEYERWAYDSCQNPWTISIATECKQLWAENNPWVKSDPVCAKYGPKHPKSVKVTKGMTLWRAAVKCYGYKYTYPEKAGHQWKRLAKKNHVKGTKIYVGQRLYC